MPKEIKKTITIKAPAAAVWDALTNPEKIKLYLFGTETRTDWQVGSPIVFSGQWDGKPYEDKGTILAIEPGKSVTYNYWSNMSGSDDIPANYANITYALEEKTGETLLTVTQDGLKDDAAAERSENDWGYVLDELRKVAEQG
ncbi:SRPBCC domain-containing protein [Emticicia sp. 21SJ11W-3]|uniref:SRPBCC family protein n=1 Tax=Emticicia sp. 21SJ11W-3 TaxID=2916755 RepID=UPI0020A0A909|nr:SRPBCC domain-containing protein [Emticicia sp. 21SJ11W-3]UTA67818.1 SRPBCC domain-containing protein [Emticicia sp. 21SJ11W-3]